METNEINPKARPTTIRSGREFCSIYFPKAHAEKRCRCYPKSEGIFVILPRPGINR